MPSTTLPFWWEPAPAAGGTVTYDVYDNRNCASTGLVGALPPVTVTSGGVPDSPTWTPDIAWHLLLRRLVLR